MFQIGRKAAELERTKLQVEIQKEKSEIRRKQLENRLKMATTNWGKGGGWGGPVKNPKKMKVQEEEEEAEDDRLDDLVVEADPDKWQTSYSNLKPGGFVTKGADKKSRLDQRQARIVVAAGKPGEDDDDDEDETEQEKLEREAMELSNQLKKAEQAESLARNKEEREKAKHFSKHISEGKYLKQPKAVTLVPQRNERKWWKWSP